MRVRLWTAALVLIIGLCGAAAAQDAPQAGGPPSEGRGAGRRPEGVGGQITAIEGSTITLQTFRGETAKVKISSSTHFMQDRADAKLSDFKVGDRVFAAGSQGSDGVWNAQMVAKRTGEFGRGGMGSGGMNQKPEDNGKTFIFGVIAKIDGTKLTIRKPDNSEQVIEVDDNTSFRNESRESITLADLKVGQFVRGQGEVKNGIFVPKALNAGMPRRITITQEPPPAGTPPAQPPADSGVPAK